MKSNNILSAMKRGVSSLVPSSGRGWFPIVREGFSGAWQRNIELTKEEILAYPAIYSCVTLIAGDISKLRLGLKRRDANGIWISTDNPAYTPVLRKPNGYQTRIQFYENWLLSILTTGNTYVLKQRDNRSVVTALYILDPARVTVKVASDGAVFYDLGEDNLNGSDIPVTVPASEIIHDRMNPLWHPLVGISPIYAAAKTVVQGTTIQDQTSNFFRNGSRPGGILTAPGALEDSTVEQLRAYWEENYTGNNAGKVAVLADGLKYESFQTANAQSSQVIEQLKWTAEVVCSVFHVPPYMIGVGALPSYDNIQALNQQYYAQALQNRIESIEVLLDEGLGLSFDLGVEFNRDDLLQMDTAALVESEKVAVGAAIKSPNEARFRLNLGPVEGGDAPLAQQQNYSLSALAKRDAKDDPFATNSSSASSRAAPVADDEEEPETNVERIYEITYDVFRKKLF